jgi:hypothetical protein
MPGQAGPRRGPRVYLEAWDGTGAFVQDRIGRGTIYVPSVCLSILGGIQTGKLASYVDDAIAGKTGDDGLLQRFQLAVYPERRKGVLCQLQAKSCPKSRSRSCCKVSHRKRTNFYTQLL